MQTRGVPRFQSFLDRPFRHRSLCHHFRPPFPPNITTQFANPFSEACPESRELDACVRSPSKRASSIRAIVRRLPVAASLRHVRRRRLEIEDSGPDTRLEKRRQDLLELEKKHPKSCPRTIKSTSQKRKDRAAAAELETSLPPLSLELSLSTWPRIISLGARTLLRQLPPSLSSKEKERLVVSCRVRDRPI